jgi:hypothetical protein
MEFQRRDRASMPQPRKGIVSIYILRHRQGRVRDRYDYPDDRFRLDSPCGRPNTDHTFS